MIRIIASFLLCVLSLTGCLNSSPGLEARDDVYVLEGIGTPEACLVSDTQCLESKFYVECDPDSATVVDICLKWLAELEGLPKHGHAQIKLLTASTYYRLSELKRWTSLPAFPHLNAQGEKLLSSEHYLLKVRELGQEVYDEDNNNIEAMRTLSLTSESDEERLQWQRLVVRTETPDYLTCRLLQGALSRVYDTPGDRSRAYSEAARCYMTSYRESEAQLGKWNMAGEVINSLESAGQTLRKNRFLSEVKEDIDPERRVQELANMRRLSLDEAEFTLQTLCLGSVREMLGIEYCSMAIEDALRSISSLASETSVSYTEAIMEGINTRLQPAGMVQTEDLNPFKKEISLLVEQEVIAKGVTSGKIYSTYSFLVNNDLEKSVDAQLKAVELEPENGDYRVTLGHLHYQRGELELAKQQYQQGLDLLPDYRKASLIRILGSMNIELD